jgi:hypothetical protein
MFKSATMMEDIRFIALTTFGGQSTAYGLENPEEGAKTTTTDDLT